MFYRLWLEAHRAESTNKGPLPHALWLSRQVAAVFATASTPFPLVFNLTFFALLLSVNSSSTISTIMGATKFESRSAVHREARNDDAATSSSAILLDDVDRYVEDEYAQGDLPPAYDEPNQTSADRTIYDGVPLWNYVYTLLVLQSLCCH